MHIAFFCDCDKHARILRRVVHIASPFFLLSYWPVFFLLLCDPDGPPTNPAVFFLARLTFWLLTIGACICVAGSTVFLFQNLKLVYQKKQIPLLDLFLDSWPFVLAVVFLLFYFFDAR